MVRGLQVALISAVCFGLGGAAALPWLLPPTEPARRSLEEASKETRPQPWWLEPFPDLASLDDTGRRPLFERSRRPPARGAGIPLAAADPALALGKYRIDGVVVSEDNRIAMVTDVSRGTLLTVREGDRLEGWLIVAVGLEGVELSRETERLQIPIGSKKQ